MRPIAMKCSQEQFDSIKDRITLPISDIGFEFKRSKYLTNYFDREYGIGSFRNGFKHNDLEVYETFDANIFLEACDIEVEKVFKAGELEYFSDNKWWPTVGEYRLKPQPNYQKEIEALQQKAKENGMNVIINFEKI